VRVRVHVHKEHVAQRLRAPDLEAVNVLYFETHTEIAKRHGLWRDANRLETMHCSKLPKGAAISHYRPNEYFPVG
jgi:hypothetical protein